MHMIKKGGISQGERETEREGVDIFRATPLRDFDMSMISNRQRVVVLFLDIPRPCSIAWHG